LGFFTNEGIWHITKPLDIQARKKEKPTPKRKAKVIVKIQINDLLDDEQSHDLESGINSEEELSNLVWWFATISFNFMKLWC
jgi:hypothetical protein